MVFRELGRRHAEALFHSEGVFGYPVGAPAGELDDLEDLVDTSPGLSIERRERLHVRIAGQLGIERWSFDQCTDVFHVPSGVFDGLAENSRRPGSRANQPEKHPDRRAFTGAIRAKKTDDASLLDVNTETIHCSQRPELLGEMIDLNSDAHRVVSPSLLCAIRLDLSDSLDPGPCKSVRDNPLNVAVEQLNIGEPLHQPKKFVVCPRVLS